MPNTFSWKFQRIGGMNQVVLNTSEDLGNLGDLDPKFWAALSCPASGLEFDARTLRLIDTDGDGRIRIPEVLAALAWTCDRLEDPASLVGPGDAMPLSAIKEDAPDGPRLLDTGRVILEKLGKPEAGRLTREDLASAVANAALDECNGDGILPPLPSLEPDVRAFIEDALAVMGGVEDASGQPGINREIADAFLLTLGERRAWRKRLREVPCPLGADTPEAWNLLQEIKGKVDDYFLRCELAAFAPETVKGLNAGPDSGQDLAAAVCRGILDQEFLQALPLARIEADRPLPLNAGINPAWRERTQRFFSLVRPLLPETETLSRPQWKVLQDSFAPYAEALAAKPVPVQVEATIPPFADPDSPGEEREEELLRGDAARRFAELAARDAASPAALADIAAMERLVLYYLHLYRLLMNFVSFSDFYSPRHNAAFQAGALYLDGRCCRLCLPVTDQEEHSALAAYSQLCLLYCVCRRRKKDGGEEESDSMVIVAAMTAGDEDLLLEGRNGVFVDNSGADWDATLVKVVSNPISLWQALWQPYKRFGRLITEQVGKFARAKEKELAALTTPKTGSAGSVLPAPPVSTAPTPGFDIGKSAGIFAAIGLALGALGTALASIANALFALHWWQFPLVLLGFFLLVSGPSFFLAWLKLRRRTLGPLLEASGWAVNCRMTVNYSLGKTLTSAATLPANAKRDFLPFRAGSGLLLSVLLAVALALAAAAIWLWRNPAALKFPW